MMTYAFSLTNGVWMLGLERLGLGVGLKGNGMCFSARGLRRFPWRAHGLVEDMEFALDAPDPGGAGPLPTRGPGLRRDGQPRRAGRRLGRGTMGGGPSRGGARFLLPIARSGALGPYRKLLYAIQLTSPTLVTLAAGLLLVAGCTRRRRSPRPWPAPRPGSCRRTR